MSPANFRELNDAQLAKLDDEKIIEYIRRARAAKRDDAVKVAARVLAFKHQVAVQGYVGSRMRRFGSITYDEVAEVALQDAIVAAVNFRGETLPEFGGLVYRIAGLRIADYHRKKRLDTTPLVFLSADGEVVWRDIPAPDSTDAVIASAIYKPVFRSCYEALNDRHKRVVVLRRFDDLSHKEVAAEINRQLPEGATDLMTDQNVAKIDSRFDECLQKGLDEAEGEPDHDG